MAESSGQNGDVPRRRIPILSCRRCRAKKGKCDTNLPCGPCLREGVECIRITNDRRRERYLAEYTESLRKRIDDLERTLSNVRNALGGETVSTTVSPSSAREPPAAAKITIKSMTNPESKSFLDARHMSVYGPTSVFDSHSVDEARSSDNHTESILALQRDPVIIHCIKLFFKWQYPDLNSFVVREAFLLEFFTPLAAPVYCSTELVLAICAMGSRVSTDEAVLERSWQFYDEAKLLVLRNLDKPAIATMQAFLLLSIFDICNGNNSSGWMLAGCGTRMGFDLGFQLNPDVWFLKSSGKLSDLNVAIRSRIYWGCYFADHFISLVLGRPSILKESDSSVSETGYLPDLEWITDYTYLAPGADPKDKSTIVDVSSPIRQLVRLINISSDMLNEVFKKDPADGFDIAVKVKKSQYYNNAILQWRESLPENLRWTRQSLAEVGENPTKMFIRYYYYILLLCLNRPFLEATSREEFSHVDFPSATICEEVVDDIIVGINRFSSIHGLHRSSILIVYCCILSVSVILISNIKRGLDDTTRQKLEFFLDVLHRTSKTWLLAEKSFKLISSQLENQFKVEIKIGENAVEIVVSENLHLSPSGFHISNVLGHAKEEAVDNSYDNFELFGGPPLLMTSDLLNQEYNTLFGIAYEEDSIRN